MNKLFGLKCLFFGARNCSLGLWLLVGSFTGVAVGRGQVGLRFSADGIEGEVVGLHDRVPAYMDGDRLKAVPANAEYKVYPKAGLLKVKGSSDADYTARLQEHQAGSWVEYARVNSWVTVTTMEQVENLYAVIGWLHDGELTHLSFRALASMKARDSWRDHFSFDLRREQLDGQLWWAVFRGDQSVAFSDQGGHDATTARWRELIRTGGDEQLAGEFRKGATFKKMPSLDAEWLAMNGKLNLLTTWANATPGWAKKVGPDLLRRAINGRRDEVVRWLLDSGVDPQAPDRTKFSAVSVAIATQQWDTLRLVLSHGHGDWTAAAYGEDPLVAAALAGRREVIPDLLAAGFRWRSGRSMVSAILAAVNDGSLEAVQILKENGAVLTDRRAVMDFEALILGTAANRGRPEMIDLLLGMKPDWRQVETDPDQTPLLSAIASNRPEVIRKFVAAGANAHLRTRDKKWDLVATAILMGSVDCARQLLELGVKPATVAEHGFELWSAVVTRRDEADAALLRKLQVAPLIADPKFRELVDQALAEDFQPLLAAAAEAEWTGAVDMGNGWNLAGLAARYARTEPSALVSGAVPRTGPAIVPPGNLRPLQVVEPAYPESLLLDGTTGEVSLELLVTETGEVAHSKILSATRPEFGRQARRAAQQWKLTPIEAGQIGWRRVKLPLAFSPAVEDAKIQRGADLDQPPILSVSTPVERPIDAPPGDGAAQVRFLIDAAGRVLDARVDRVTNEAWRAAVMNAVVKWEFRPGILGGRATQCFNDFTLRLPGAQFLAAEGTPLEKVGAVGDAAPWVISKKDLKRPEFLSEGELGLVMLEGIAAKNGRMRELVVLASSDPRLDKLAIKNVETWRHRPARHDGANVDAPLVMWVAF